MDVRLTLGEVGRWGRAVLDHGGDPVGRSAAGGWLAICKSWFGSSLRDGRGLMNWGRRRNRGSRLDSPRRRRRRR